MYLDYIKYHINIFTKYLIIFCSILITNTLSIGNDAYALEDIIVGKHYKTIPDKIRNTNIVSQFIAKDPNKEQVLIFFSYACHWCDILNKPIKEWALQKNNVAIYYIPVAFSHVYESLARAYFTAEELDKSGKISDAIYYGILTEQKNYARESLLRELFVKNGIDENLFNSTYNSFAINLKVSDAKSLTEAYNIGSTPNIIVNGKTNSYLTNLAMTKDISVLLQTIDFLLKLDR